MLENRAASIETSIDTVAGSASFDSLVNDAELVLSLFADVIQRPAFAPDRVDFLKGQYRGSIARRNDDPDSITGREFAKLIYGADSPYGRTVEYATLESISRQDVEAFYRASIRPDRTILGLEGDFDSTRMKTLVNQYFGDWQGEGEALDITHLPVVGQAKAGLFAIEQPQLTQSYVQLGHLGGQFNAPDYPALEVMNEVLNSFSGRLFNQVRSRQGLAYSVYAFWSPRYDYPGMFIGGGETRSTTTVPFIQAVKREIERIRTSPITLEELTLAKDSVLNSFVFKFQKSSQILARLIRNEYYHYPANFIFQFQEQVRKITASDVLAAAQERLKLDQLAILVVGNSADIQPALATLEPQQPVQVLDITIPSDQKT
ncbi:MAG: insulinase family protein [Nodosilinea sp. LVE1205-7]